MRDGLACPSTMSLDFVALIFTLSDALKSLKTVEIIPGDYNQWASSGITPEFPFLLSEGNLGIPKKILYRLYISALHIFGTKERAQTSPKQLLASSSIILLTNPAYQTALNARKMLVHSGEHDAQTELDFLRAVMSGSREAAKQSIVWHHRRWMLRFLYSSSSPSQSIVSEDTLLDIPFEDLKAELQLVTHSCELYPRNYYAWTHRLYCMGILHHLITHGVPHSTEMLNEELSSSLRWIDFHLSDYTAMHYVCQLVTRFPSQMRFDSLFEHAISLIETYPGHEALWMYLRNVLCSATVDECRVFATHLSNIPLGSTTDCQRCLTYTSKMKS